MKKVCLTLTVCLLALTACQKEVKQNDDEVRYSNYYVRSYKDPAKWITIEERNKVEPPTKIGDDRTWEDCYFQNRNGDYEKGRSCSNTRHYGCTEVAGCFKKPA